MKQNIHHKFLEQAHAILEKRGIKTPLFQNSNKEKESQQITIPAPKLNNDLIKRKRQIAYKTRSDQYLMSYLAYTELGEHEKAAEMKELWIQERTKIDNENPYMTE